jgi:hypothetical protein
VGIATPRCDHHRYLGYTVAYPYAWHLNPSAYRPSHSHTDTPLLSLPVSLTLSLWQREYIVTGGAAHFKLPTEHKDKIMRGMMDGTRSLRPWFITGGSNAGIMKYVGEARAKYNPAAPLIGVCALAEMAGLKKLRKICREQRTWEEKEKAWRHSRTLSNQSIRSESSAPGDDEGMEQEGLVWKEQEDWYWHAKDGTWRKGLDAHGPELSYEDVLEMDEEQHLNERKAAIVKQLQSDILHLQDELDDPQMQDRMQDLQEEMRKKKTELERTQKEARKRY